MFPSTRLSSSWRLVWIGLIFICRALCLSSTAAGGLEGAVSAAGGAGFPSGGSCPDGEQQSSEQAVGISFSPEVLEYSDSPVCIPAVSEFALHNDRDREVHIYSVASDSSQFHPVSFQPQVLLPKDSLNIQLLFLPYHMKATDAMLTISTSVGEFEYRIVGTATSNPYNLRPFIGNKVVAGVPFEQPIVLLNPHDSVLHIREIFTTEEFLSLHRSGPGGADRDEPHDPDSWELEAGAEREVIRLVMSSAVPGHYYGYVHVKTDKDKIVIPVDLQVLEGGLRAVDSLLDFGVFTQSNALKSIELKLANSGSADVSILDVVPATPDPQLTVAVRSRVVRAGEEEVVALLSYHGAKPGKVSNKVLVTTDNSNSAYATLEVPYEASMLQGGIGFNFNQSVFTVPIWNETRVAAAQMDAFQSGSAGYIVRNLVFTNFFSVPVSLQGISAATCRAVINVIAIPSAVSANRLESWSPVVLLYNVSNAIITSISKDGLPFTCWLELWTNISSHRIPLHVLDGDLNVKLLNEKASRKGAGRGGGKRKGTGAGFAATQGNFDVHDIDFKTLNVRMPEGLLFAVENTNPQRIPLYLANTSGPMCLCVEAVLPTESVGKAPGQAIEALFPSKFVPPKSAADPNCSCYDAFGGSFSQEQLHTGDVPADRSRVFNSAFGAFLSTGNPEDDVDMASFSPSDRGDDGTAPAGLPFLRLNARQTAFVSVHLVGLKMGVGKIALNITSPYQSKIFSVNYSVTDGDIDLSSRDSFEAADAFVMGRYRHIDVRARSDLQFALPVRSLRVSSPHFSAPAELSLPNLPARIRSSPPSDAGDLTEAVLSTIGGLVPDFLCLPDPAAARATSAFMNVSHDLTREVGIVPLSSPPSKSPSGKYSVWACIRKVLSMANVAGKRVSAGVGFRGVRDIGAALDAIDHVEQALAAQRWAAAHNATVTFAAEWGKLYPGGFRLRPFNVTLATDAGLTSSVIDNVTLALPVEFTPPAVEIVLPPSQTFEGREFYVKVVNPFDVYLSFSLADADGSSSSALHAAGSSPTPPPSTAPTVGAVPESIDEEQFVHAVFPKSWAPSGCKRYSVLAPKASAATDVLPRLLVDALAGVRLLDASLAHNENRIASIKILMNSPAVPKRAMIEETKKRINLLKAKLDMLRKAEKELSVEGRGDEAVQALLDYLLRESNQVEGEMDRVSRVMDTLPAKAFDSQAGKTMNKKAESSKKSTSSFFGGGIVDPLSDDILARSRSELSTSGDGPFVGSTDWEMELTLLEKSLRFQHAVGADHSAVFSSSAELDTVELGLNFSTSLSMQRSTCGEGALSPIVSGAVVTRSWPSSAEYRQRGGGAGAQGGSPASPFVLSSLFPLEAVIAPRSTGYIGPIVFESAMEGIFQKTFFVVNNFTGTDRVDVIGESGSSAPFLRRIVYFPNVSAKSDEHTYQSIDMSWDPKQPFGSSPIIYNHGPAGVSVLVKNLDGSVGTPRVVDSTGYAQLTIDDSSGKVAYTFENTGVIGFQVHDLEINGERVCRASASAMYSELCVNLPYTLNVNSSWVVQVPLEVDCSVRRSTMEVRLIAGDQEETLFAAKYTTVLGLSMIQYCLHERSHSYSRSVLLSSIKLTIVVICMINFYFFYAKYSANCSATKRVLLVDGEDVFGGVSEAFLKHARNEMSGSSQRGRRATALGSASAPEKRKTPSKVGGSGARAGNDRVDSWTFEDLVRADEIDLSISPTSSSSALGNYSEYCRRRDEAITNGKAGGASLVRQSVDVLSGALPTDSAVQPGPTPESAAQNHCLSEKTVHVRDVPKHPISRHVGSNRHSGAKKIDDSRDEISAHESATSGAVSGLPPEPNAVEVTPESITGLTVSLPTATVAPPTKPLSPIAPPGIKTLNSNRGWGESRSFGSASDGDLDFDPSDFNMLIDQDLRALLVKPLDRAPAAPPGFGPLPMDRVAENVSNLDKDTDFPKISLGSRNVSDSNFQEKFIDDLLLDEMSPLASDPTLKSFFSGVAAPHNRSLKERAGHDIFNLGGNDAHTYDDPYNSVMHLLDTESLQLPMTSTNSPAEPVSASSTPQYRQAPRKFSPPTFGGAIAGSLHNFPAQSSSKSPYGPGAVVRGNLAASLTRPGDISPGNPVAQNQRSGQKSQFQSSSTFSYPSLTLDTAVPSAKVPEKSSGGRFAKSSPTSSSGLPLAAALPPMVGGHRSSGSSPRMTGTSGPPGIPGRGNIPEGNRPLVTSSTRNKLAANVRPSTVSGAPPPGLAPAHPAPPGLSAPAHRMGDIFGGQGSDSGVKESFFGEGSFFGSSMRGRTSSKGSSVSDDVLLQPPSSDQKSIADR